MIGVIFCTAQGVGAYFAGSIAVAADCAHLATDMLGIVISMVALWLTRKEKSFSYSFGWHRSEILGTIMSLLFLLGVTLWLVVEAFERIFVDYDIDGEIMLVTAVLSLIFNLLMLETLHQAKPHDHDHDHGDDGHDHGHGHGHHHHEGGHKEEHHHDHHDHNGHAEEKLSKKANSAKLSKEALEEDKHKNINVDAAFLHILGDLLMSVGVTIAGLVIYFYPPKDYPWSKYVDPACTLLFSILVFFSCKKTLGGCIYILMEGAPEGVKSEDLKEEIESLPNEVKMVDYHIWSLSRGKNLMTAQITCRGEPMKVLAEVTAKCKEYGLEQCTIQVEDLDALHGEQCSKPYQF